MNFLFRNSTHFRKAFEFKTVGYVVKMLHKHFFSLTP